MNTDAPRPTRVTVGRIAGVYGVKGWVKIVSFTRPIDSILRYRDWFVGPAGVDMKMLEGKTHGAGLIAQIGNVNGVALENRDQAARLVGSEIAIPRAALPPTVGDEIYWVDMIGLKVVSTEGEPLGVVESVTDNGAQDVLTLHDAQHVDETGKPVPRLIPFVRGPIIQSVNIEQGLIVAHWSPDW